MGTVMIVEDDVDVREAEADVLEAEGYCVVQAGNGKIALDLLHGGAMPNVIVLDLMMPVLSGPEMLELMQSEPELARVPVIVVSAFDHGAAHGVKEFIHKPITAAKLREVVGHYACAC